MTSGPVTLCQIDGEKVETKAMKNLDSTLKSKDVTLLTKIRIIKAMIFTEVRYGFKSWIIK